nr:hypothetical protein BgiMline_027757 [Biomphalaria glabrata]
MTTFKLNHPITHGGKLVPTLVGPKARDSTGSPKRHRAPRMLVYNLLMIGPDRKSRNRVIPGFQPMTSGPYSAYKIKLIDHCRFIVSNCQIDIAL